MVSRTEPHLVALQRGTVEIQCDYLDIVFVEHNLILVQTEGKSYQGYEAYEPYEPYELYEPYQNFPIPEKCKNIQK